MIEHLGGPLSFLREFHRAMADNGNWWLHKCKNRPQHDIAWVYVVVANRIRYRVNYGGYQKGETTIYRRLKRQVKREPNPDYPHNYWQTVEEIVPCVITWPRILLVGPIVRAPGDFPMRGFQGFQYVPEKIF